MSAGRHIKSELSRLALGRIVLNSNKIYIRRYAERQPPARIIQLLIGTSQPNMVTRQFVLISDHHQTTEDHPNALGNILRRPE